ncbi:MAG TPA: phosphopantetheine-binding protein, partial [Thermoanaerobaculia bacterium]|nr:phosphopantetheine-binding protein [Thermoanaerobaculia bacterium]
GVPIGAPIANTRVHVVDRLLRPVAIGAVGELVIGGEGVARGYRNRPALTASRFVPDPFGPPGARLYRTGDRARWRRDGLLEFLGRADDQVKIRGFRVELGEVEAALAAHPHVAAAAVVAHDGGAGAALVAFVVPRNGDSLSPRELRAKAAERLPAYMIPTHVIVRDALPLSTAGKVDRRALLASLRDAASIGETIVEAPRTETEKTIAAAWSEVLGRPSPSLDTSFFEIGGHSLLGVRMVSLLHRRLGVQLPLRTLFDTGTIRTMAAAVDRLRPDAQTSDRFQEGEL